MLITLYARQEPTNDGILLSLSLESKRHDTVIYKDRECTEIKATIPWHYRNRPISRKTITLNCYRFNLEWLPKVVH